MPGTTPTMSRGGRRQRTLPIGLLALIGGVLGVSAIEFLVTHPDPPMLWRMELLVVAGVTTGIMYAGYRLFAGHYATTDLWKILGWTVAGVVAAAALGSAIYAHQQIEQVTIAEPTFLLEFLALIGAGVGLAFGVSRRSLFDRTPRSEADATTRIESDLWELLSLLDNDTEALRQRWTMLEHLADTSTKELPIAAFVVQLADARSSPFPDDEDETRSLVHDEHLPVLLESGLVEIDDELGTIRYVGPDSLTEHVAE